MLIQLLADSVALGCGYALTALGFGLIYATTRVFHIAHGAVYAAGAYAFYWAFAGLGWPAYASGIFAFVVAAALGILVEVIVYRPLWRTRASSTCALLASLGVYITVANVLAAFFGDETRVSSSGPGPTVSLGSVLLTESQVQLAVVFVLASFGLHALLRYTGLGRAVRALRDDEVLLSVSGIDVSRLRIAIMGLGSGLAGLAAGLASPDQAIDPNIGMAAVLTAAVAVILTGVGRFEMAALGAILIALLQGLTIWRFSAQWVPAITFGLLALTLVFRPQGIFGRLTRVEEL